jgi:iron complex outermembrane receptor protein
VDLRLSLTQELFLFGGMSYVQARKETKPEKNINSSNVAEIPPLKTRIALRIRQRHVFWRSGNDPFRNSE